jgi:hypothetical protein
MTTRAERLTTLLTEIFDDAGWTLRPESQIIAEILAIADDRTFITLKRFSQLIGRDGTTILSWIQRGQHDIPPEICNPGNGRIWDEADILVWRDTHEHLVGISGRAKDPIL